MLDGRDQVGALRLQPRITRRQPRRVPGDLVAAGGQLELFRAEIRSALLTW